MKKIKIEIDLADVFELETEDSDSSVIETSLNKIKQKIVREAIYDEARSIYRTEILQYKETKDIQKEIDNFFNLFNRNYKLIWYSEPTVRKIEKEIHDLLGNNYCG